MSKPGHNNPNTMWPRDYLVRRIRLAEYQIEIAFKHKNRKILARGKYFPYFETIFKHLKIGKCFPKRKYY